LAPAGTGRGLVAAVAAGEAAAAGDVAGAGAAAAGEAAVALAGETAAGALGGEAAAGALGGDAAGAGGAAGAGAGGAAGAAQPTRATIRATNGRRRTTAGHEDHGATGAPPLHLLRAGSRRRPGAGRRGQPGPAQFYRSGRTASTPGAVGHMAPAVAPLRGLGGLPATRVPGGAGFDGRQSAGPALA